ncbi:hypothetical protein G9P44_004803 [Scheffersomyces stipitis]|nr:hypothetical protein G9P44_004803 [Scheffersomyces stipitis]
MFENLKAFIRHGKQANDLKKKQAAATAASSASQAANINNTNYSLNDYAYDNSRGYADIDAYSISNEPSTTTLVENEARAQQVDAEPKDTQNVYSTTYTDNYNYNDNNYQKVATHIVEEERLQRQKQKTAKYPNLDNYEVLENIGEGAFSVVYKARHKVTNKLVAIKILRKFQMDQAQKSAVLKEVTIMRQLDHPNIVRFIEFIDSDLYYYIVQELAPGGEIFTAIVKYTYFSEDLARHVIRQVAEAIQYLHDEVGIVHRDIKPENLLYVPIDTKPSVNPVAKLRKSDDPNAKLDEGEFVPGVGGGGIGVVKLADFGLSKQIWEHNTKTPCGTVGYTAPEIVRDERYSREVDMWAIGCVLYTLLCGFPPFYDESIDTLTEKVAKGEYTFLSPWWDEISDGAKHCVSKLLTVDPSKRYAIADFLNDPWLTKPYNVQVSHDAPASARAGRDKHPIQTHNGSNRYSKKYTNGTHNDLYSPAAVALRDAFDISTAVHRMGEEAALSKINTFDNVVEGIEEEDEDQIEEDVNIQGQVLNKHKITTPRNARLNKQHQQPNMFDLNLGGASILERRKHKQVPVKS